MKSTIDLNSRTHAEFFRRRLLLSLLGAIVLIAALVPANASALQTHLFEETFGSAAQQEFKVAEGIAVDAQTNDLIVLENFTPFAGSPEAALTRFKPNGEPDPFSALGTNEINGKRGPGGRSCAEESESCDATPQSGLNFPQFTPSSAYQVTVDDSGTETDGDIYVTQGDPVSGSPSLVDIFGRDGSYLGQITGAGSTSFASANFNPCGVAVGANGALFVGGFNQSTFESTIYKYTQGESPHSPLQNSDNSLEFSSPVRATCNLATGSAATAGSLFAVSGNTYMGNGVLKFSEQGVLEGSLSPEWDHHLAVEPGSGYLWAWTKEEAGGSGVGTVTGYSGQEPIGNVIEDITGIAFSPTADKLYLAKNRQGEENSIAVYGPLVTVPDVSSEHAAIGGPEAVTLKGTVNPDGEPLTSCFFEYGLTNEYGEEAPCEDPDAAAVGSGDAPVPVHADLTGLQKEAIYHFRVVAENANAALYPNADNAISRSDDETVQLPAKPVIKSQWTVGAGERDATLSAIINPNQAETSYRLQWGETASYGEETSAAPVAPGSDGEDHKVSVTIDSLEPGTTYHYRFLAKNALGEAQATDGAFTTYAVPVSEACPGNEAFRGGASGDLPDCRAFEMVSPVEKEGGDTLVLGELLSARPAVLDQSATSGDKLAFGSSRAFAGSSSSAFTNQYISERHAGQGWSTHLISPPRGRPIYEVAAQTDTEFKLFSDDLCEAWLSNLAEGSWATAVGAPAGYSDLFRREDDGCGGPAYEPLSLRTPSEISPNDFKTELQGVAGHGSQSISAFIANSRLANGATAGPVQLYVSQGRAVKFACILPGGAAFKGSCTAGWSQLLLGHYRTGVMSNALSADGSKLYWTEWAAGGEGDGKIYLRENPAGSGAECGGPSTPCTLAVSAAAEAEVGGIRSHFHGASEDGSKVIFTTRSVDPITNDQGPVQLYEWRAGSESTQLIAEDIVGVVGASSDLNRVYFGSRGVLSGANSEGRSPQQNANNLYLYEEGSGIRFIAALATDDEVGSHDSPLDDTSWNHVARVSADGSHVVFQSLAQLTAYDNSDAITENPDVELYLYSADADGGNGELLCPSCNPSGARPHGLAARTQPRHLVAAHIPVPLNNLYASRALSTNGRRLFFDSSDPLVPRDVNGRDDVYEWEQPGEGGCTTGSSAYSPQNGGCVDLISTGDSDFNSEFVDASPSGSDVFFTTLSSLAPQDPGSVDIYDARVDGGLPSPPQPPPPCEGEGCQPAGASAPAVPRPGSRQVGGGNPKSVKPGCPAGKRLVKQGGKSKCVKGKKHHKKKHHKKKHHKKKHHKKKHHKTRGAGR